VSLHFVVHGVAQPKGSARAFMPKNGKFPVVTSDNPRVRSWQHLVADAASRVIGETRWRMLDTAVRVTVAFHLPRPRKFQRQAAPVAHLTNPDVDKLVRAVFDALTQVAWVDDRQVVDLVAMKRYAAVDAPPSIEVWVDEAVGPFEAPPRHQPLLALEN
jgi:crossover junction endodeoxyribonuclease RusA